MGNLVTTSIDLYVENCCNCGMSFAMTTDFKKRRRGDHDWFYCPSGHAQRYTAKSDEENLKEELRREKLERESAEASKKLAWEEAEKAIRSQRAYKGQLTKTRKRIAKGVCPCCNRQFKDLHTHMTIKHPDYTGEQVEVK